MKTIIGNITKTIIHQVGNKNNGDGVRFSTTESSIKDEINTVFQGMLIKSFKMDLLHQFYFEPTLQLNPIYVFCNNLFNDKSQFVAETQNISRYLYEKSTHPKIKNSEVCFLYIENCMLNDVETEAICILKSENKETILQFQKEDEGYNIVKQQGLGLGRLDKGCIIYNIDDDNGYICSVVDTGAKKGEEAKFWMDDFLHMRPINNSYNKTKAVVEVISTYLNSEMPHSFETSKSEQAILINNAVNELKSCKEINVQKISIKIFNEVEVQKDFERYFENFQVEKSMILDGDIEIDKSAIKMPNFKSSKL